VRGAETLLSRADSAWDEIILASITALPLTNPLSNAFLTILHDSLPTPKLSLAVALGHKLVGFFTSHCGVQERRNALATWAIIAEHLAGHHGEQLLTSDIVHVLMRTIEQADSSLLRLTALVAAEKFAMTGACVHSACCIPTCLMLSGANKKRLLDAGIAQAVYNLETHNSTDGVPRDELMRREQIRFCCGWLLDNVFPCPGRPFTHESLDTSGVNVMLDIKDATKHLKVGPGSPAYHHPSLRHRPADRSQRARGQERLGQL
jgi:hypothetical protein